MRGWGKEALRWRMTEPPEGWRRPVFQQSGWVVVHLPSSEGPPGSGRPSCCSNIPAKAEPPSSKANLQSPASGCCDWTLTGPPPPSRRAALWAQRSPGSVRLWELWKHLRMQRVQCSRSVGTEDKSAVNVIPLLTASITRESIIVSSIIDQHLVESNDSNLWEQLESQTSWEGNSLI